AVAVVEVIVDQQAVERDTRLGNGRDTAGEIRRLEHMTAPAPQQRFHAVEDGKLIVDAQDRRAGKLPGIDGRCFALRGNIRDSRSERHFGGETRPASDDGADLDLVIQHPRDALDDGKAKSKPARDAGALIEPVKLFEDLALL